MGASELIPDLFGSVELAKFVDDHLVELVFAIIKEHLSGNVNLGQGQRHLLLDHFDLLLLLNLLLLLLSLLLSDFHDGTLRLLSLFIEIEVGGNLIFAHDCLEDHISTCCCHLMFHDSLWVP